MMLKWTTQNLVKNGNGSGLCGAYPDWAMHPSWIAGVEGLDAYNRWVCEVLIPIVFQWIEEHYKEVYQGISDENKDDVGVVVASAFEIVKTMSSYKNGLEKAKEFEEAKETGAVDLKTINPVWADIARKVREDTKKIFDHKEDVLKGTIR
ncbi:hypothetical protein [Tunturibacter empetritectus]|uniref:Uncharacterized protein n=1 Tax=Tunturiibacter empetritectus TaxID=3069691 RepID=A0A7W8MR13_9BACT|nr:hypothetical protein [Edaphobacter lichenicola]MBB5317143.1 hypothetical protein [Edaphobacter lichenicola]